MKFDRYEQTPSVDAFFKNNALLQDWEVGVLHQQFNVNQCDIEDEFGDTEEDDFGAAPEDDSHLIFPARMPPAQRRKLREAYRDFERMYR